ncbi:MAG: hypothetical protein JXB04_05275 [Kiritimatiellae bacterium]|nr:hypothetical protein [Kiritimatiellia bacterium]
MQYPRRRPAHPQRSTAHPATLSVAVCLLATALNAAPPEYHRSLAAAEEAREAGAASREVSDTLLWGAGKCRDAGTHEEAEELFLAAIRQDPHNARAHRLYGDYLMGYRGLYEYAAAHYRLAIELVRRNPSAYDRAFKQDLERSIQILHRDGKDGIPVFESGPLSVYVEADASYQNAAPRPLDLLGQEHQAACYYNGSYRQEREDGIAYYQGLIGDQNNGIRFFKGAVRDNEAGFDQWLDDLYDRFMDDYGYIPADDEVLDFYPNGKPMTVSSRRKDKDVYSKELKGKVKDIEKDKWHTQQRIRTLEDELEAIPGLLAAVPGQLRRRRPEQKYATTIMTRFGPTALPSLRITLERTEVEDAGINPEDLEHGYDGAYNREAVALLKSIRLPLTIDLHAEVEAQQRRSRLYDPFHNHRVYEEETRELGAQTTFEWHRGRGVAKLLLGATAAEIENDYTDEDTSYSRLAAVRLSRYRGGDEAEASPRYRGRRSQHWEAGLRRSRRYYRSPEDPTVTETIDQPYTTWEEFGLWRGGMDLLLKYEFIQQEIADGCPEGVYHMHEVTLQPTWVPVYRLYENGFRTGLEQATVAFPLRAAFGEGDYDRFGAGVLIEQRLVTRYGLEISPSLSANYFLYPDLDRSDWGIFARCRLTGGAKRRLPATPSAPGREQSAQYSAVSAQ